MWSGDVDLTGGCDEELGRATRSSTSADWATASASAVKSLCCCCRRRAVKVFPAGRVWKKNLPCARARKPFVVSSLDLLMLLQ
ncbi:hypothetical protein DAI22_01g198800 [Oryza sativa Japonica Group]|nr:hypothetical protein DAI22_01g198800 [Oryza sativa Japonica Group]